ncbi:hypothetical protein [Oryza sativa Japonica Group]|uniref:Uncharacterized protein OJ1123_G09.10 n=1 Tax=Oryza sativa subsp. japonica TaxID=39947 RepID=Q8LH54_ORYSJ|nr:hypothetical protein [Oryza sativa Japonica Group]
MTVGESMSTVKGRARPVDHPKRWWRRKSWCELGENGVRTVLGCGEGAIEVGGDATKPELVAPRRKEVLTTAKLGRSSATAAAERERESNDGSSFRVECGWGRGGGLESGELVVSNPVAFNGPGKICGRISGQFKRREREEGKWRERERETRVVNPPFQAGGNGGAMVRRGQQERREVGDDRWVRMLASVVCGAVCVQVGRPSKRGEADQADGRRERNGMGHIITL